jgi:hypothetical protein
MSSEKIDTSVNIHSTQVSLKSKDEVLDKSNVLKETTNSITSSQTNLDKSSLGNASLRIVPSLPSNSVSTQSNAVDITPATSARSDPTNFSEMSARSRPSEEDLNVSENDSSFSTVGQQIDQNSVPEGPNAARIFVARIPKGTGHLWVIDYLVRFGRLVYWRPLPHRPTDLNLAIMAYFETPEEAAAVIAGLHNLPVSDDGPILDPFSPDYITQRNHIMAELSAENPAPGFTVQDVHLLRVEYSKAQPESTGSGGGSRRGGSGGGGRGGGGRRSANNSTNTSAGGNVSEESNSDGYLSESSRILAEEIAKDMSKGQEDDLEDRIEVARERSTSIGSQVRRVNTSTPSVSSSGLISSLEAVDLNDDTPSFGSNVRRRGTNRSMPDGNFQNNMPSGSPTPMMSGAMNIPAFRAVVPGSYPSQHYGHPAQHIRGRGGRAPYYAHNMNPGTYYPGPLYKGMPQMENMYYPHGPVNPGGMPFAPGPMMMPPYMVPHYTDHDGASNFDPRLGPNPSQLQMQHALLAQQHFQNAVMAHMAGTSAGAFVGSPMIPGYFPPGQNMPTGAHINPYVPSMGMPNSPPMMHWPSRHQSSVTNSPGTLMQRSQLVESLIERIVESNRSHSTAVKIANALVNAVDEATLSNLLQSPAELNTYCAKIEADDNKNESSKTISTKSIGPVPVSPTDGNSNPRSRTVSDASVSSAQRRKSM